VLTRTQ